MSSYLSTNYPTFDAERARLKLSFSEIADGVNESTSKEMFTLEKLSKSLKDKRKLSLKEAMEIRNYLILKGMSVMTIDELFSQ